MDPNQCLKYLFRRLQKSFSKLKGCVLLKAYSDYAASLQWPATDGCELQFIGKFSQHTSPLRICSTLWLVWADIIPWLQVRIHPRWDEDFGGVGPAESYIFFVNLKVCWLPRNLALPNVDNMGFTYLELRVEMKLFSCVLWTRNIPLWNRINVYQHSLQQHKKRFCYTSSTVNWGLRAHLHDDVNTTYLH